MMVMLLVVMVMVMVTVMIPWRGETNYRWQQRGRKILQIVFLPSWTDRADAPDGGGPLAVVAMEGLRYGGDSI